MIIKRKIYFILPIILVLLAGVASAQDKEGDFSSEDVITIFNNFATLLVIVAVSIMTIFIVYYAVQMGTAGGNAAKFQEAKKGFFWALLGAMVIFGAYVIIATVANIVSGKF